MNTADARYDAAGTALNATSNTNTILIAERLDVALSRSTSDPVSASTTAVEFVLTNRGNGMEAFRLSAAVDRGEAPTRFALDVNANGRYDVDTDTLLTDATTPLLAPGAMLPLLLLGDTDGAFDGTITTITARATTGFGNPGTTFAGLGDGGGDALVGNTGAQAQLTVPIIRTAALPSLEKTQSVLAPDGSARAVRGAVITYTLTADFTAATTRARIDDPVPAGTAYVPGSMVLDAVPLSDAADGDAGQADTGAVSAALGAVAAASTHVFQFQVRIQ